MRSEEVEETQRVRGWQPLSVGEGRVIYGQPLLKDPVDKVRGRWRERGWRELKKYDGIPARLLVGV